MPHFATMQNAFSLVVFAVVVVGVLGGLIALILSTGAWDEIGSGGFYSDRDAPKPGAAGGGDAGERDAEIRQMLTARNARRADRGLETVDVEEELARLTAPAPVAADEELRGELRELAIARNHRRARKGQAPLDVEAEVQRRLEELGG